MLDAETVRRLLDYDPATGVFTWKARGNPQWDARYAGKRAGSLHRQGYLQMRMNDRQYLAHRLAWLHVHGTLPDYLDHINRDTADNRIANLRLATYSQNNANSRRHKDNKCGFKGVYRRHGKWRAQISDGYSSDGRKRMRHLGFFDSAEAAHEAYMRAAREKFGEFAYMGFLTRGSA
jgi:hypothetical protein